MTVRIGFVGAGGIAQWQHFDTLEDTDDAEVVGICDVDEETATDAADRFDAQAYTDYRDLYDEVALDAVFICLPPFAHEGQEVEAAERGIDLFVEKPLALDVDTAETVRDAIAETDVVAQVGYNWRYALGIERARDILADRTIGYLDGYWWGGVPGGSDHWWHRRDRSGGQVVEQATHVFDAIRYLAGDVERVSAAGETRISDLVDFPDVTSATMEHESGAISHVSTSCVADPGKTGLEIIADGATLTVTQDAIKGTVDDEEIDASSEQNPYVAEVEDFLAAVSRGDDDGIRSTYADAVASLRLTLAVTESIDRSTPIDLG